MPNTEDQKTRLIHRINIVIDEWTDEFLSMLRENSDNIPAFIINVIPYLYDISFNTGKRHLRIKFVGHHLLGVMNFAVGFNKNDEYVREASVFVMNIDGCSPNTVVQKDFHELVLQPAIHYHPEIFKNHLKFVLLDMVTKIIEHFAEFAQIIKMTYPNVCERCQNDSNQIVGIECEDMTDVKNLINDTNKITI